MCSSRVLKKASNIVCKERAFIKRVCDMRVCLGIPLILCAYGTVLSVQRGQSDTSVCRGSTSGCGLVARRGGVSLVFLALSLLHGSYPLISLTFTCVLRSSHLPASPGSSLNSNLNMVGETGQRRRDLPATGRPAGVHTARRSARPRAAAWRRSCRSGWRCAKPCYRAPPPSAR